MDQVQNEQAQFRSIVAANRQQLQAMDVRMRQLEDQIQQLRNSPAGAPVDPAKAGASEDRLARLEAAVTALQASSTAPTYAPPPSSTVPTEPPDRTASLGGGSSSTTPSGTLPGYSGPPNATSPPPSTRGAGPTGASLEADVEHEMEAARNVSGPGSKLYREGLEAMKSGNYAAAIEKFTLLQKKYPKSELTEPGEYFSASAFYELGKYDQSILQFNDLVMRFPKGRFASTALLKEAQAFVELKDKIDARLTLQKLLAEHGDAPEASAARDMMRKLES
jgi:tol-pal system protein YbgF